MDVLHTLPCPFRAILGVGVGCKKSVEEINSPTGLWTALNGKDSPQKCDAASRACAGSRGASTAVLPTPTSGICSRASAHSQQAAPQHPTMLTMKKSPSPVPAGSSLVGGARPRERNPSGQVTRLMPTQEAVPRPEPCWEKSRSVSVASGTLVPIPITRIGLPAVQSKLYCSDGQEGCGSFWAGGSAEVSVAEKPALRRTWVLRAQYGASGARRLKPVCSMHRLFAGSCCAQSSW